MDARVARGTPPELVRVRPTDGSLTAAFDAVDEVAERIERSGADLVAVAFSEPRDRSVESRFLMRALTLQAEVRGKQVLFLN